MVLPPWRKIFLKTVAVAGTADKPVSKETIR
jgi:hypothetical protein